MDWVWLGLKQDQLAIKKSITIQAHKNLTTNHQPNTKT